MANWGLLGALGEGLKSGVESYRTERDYQRKKELEEADREMKRKMYSADLAHKGLLEKEGGLIEKTPEQIKNDAAKAAAERSGLLGQGHDLGEFDPSTGQYSIKETPYGQARTRKTIAEAGEFEAKALASRTGKDPSKSREYGTTLRNEYQKHPDVVTADSVETSYEKMLGAAKDPSGASDMSLVYGFMKMQDPSTGVKEGELALAGQTGGVPAYIVNLYNKTVDGQFLSPKQREDFLKQARSIAQTSQKRRESRKRAYAALADQYGVPRSYLFNQEDEGDGRGLLGERSAQSLPVSASAGLGQSPQFQTGQERTSSVTGEVQVWDGAKWVSRGRK